MGRALHGGPSALIERADGLERAGGRNEVGELVLAAVSFLSSRHGSCLPLRFAGINHRPI